MLFVAVMVGVCAAVGMLLVRERPPPDAEREDDAAVRRVFVAGYVLTAVLAAQLVGSALAGEFLREQGYGEHARLAMTAVRP